MTNGHNHRLRKNRIKAAMATMTSKPPRSTIQERPMFVCGSLFFVLGSWFLAGNVFMADFARDGRV